MHLSAWIVLIYSLLILIGGMIGYSQAHSLPSLISGSIFGFLLLLCSIGMFKKSVLAYTLSLALSAMLTLFFFYRFIITMKLMPAGMMAIISLSTITFILWNRKRKKLYS